MTRLKFTKHCALAIATYSLALAANAADPILCVPPPLPGDVGDVVALVSCINTANIEGGGTIDLGGLTYTLTTTDNTTDGDNGLPDITSIITLKNGTITKDPTLPFRHLHISPPGTLNLKGVTLTNGYASGNGGGSIFVAVGAILGTVEDSVFSENQANLTLGVNSLGGAICVQGEFFAIKNTLFSNNQAINLTSAALFIAGGAIYMGTQGPAKGGTISETIFVSNFATASITNFPVGGAISLDTGASMGAVVRSSFISNGTTTVGNLGVATIGEGGAIYIVPGAEITVLDSNSFSFNFSGDGGAILSTGTIGTLSNSTFNNNISVVAGAVLVDGNLATVYNCTFTANVASFSGGAFYIGNDATIGQFFNNTVAVNFASTFESPFNGAGGGIFNCGTIGDMVSNIVAANYNTFTTPPTEDDVANTDCPGTINAASFNLIGSNANNSLVNGVDSNIVGTANAPINPNLDVLRDNGGPTFTMAPLSNSPAIGAGANPLGLRHDQRGEGFARSVHAQTDIGAVEVQRSPR